MAVALIALFISLGGVSYGVATGSIDSRELKNNAVRSNAASADAANSVNGASIRKIDFRTSSTTPETEILNFNGLSLRATCDLGGPPGTTIFTLGVRASTAGGDADLVSESRRPVNNDFSSGEEVANGVLLSGGFGTGAGDANNVQLISSSAGGTNGTTHFRASDGRAVVVHWSASDFSPPCWFHGYAVGT